MQEQGDEDTLAEIYAQDLAGEEDGDGETEGGALSTKERNLVQQIGALRTRLRELLLIRHQIRFQWGSAYFAMGKFAVAEAFQYAEAESIRETLHRPYFARVEASASRLERLLTARDEKSTLDIDSLEFPFAPEGTRPGINTAAVFENIEATTDALNGFAQLMWEAHEVALSAVLSDISGEIVEVRSLLLSVTWS